MYQQVIRQFPASTVAARRKRKLRTFVIYSSPLFVDLVSNLLDASDEVRLVGRSADVREAARSIAASAADVVLVEGNPNDIHDLGILSYLVLTAGEAPWSDMVVFNVNEKTYASFHRGNVKRLDASRLLSLISGGER